MGTTVSVSGAVAAVSIYRSNTFGSNGGAVAIFQAQDADNIRGAWIFLTYLTPSGDVGTNSYFGKYMDMWGPVVCVSATLSAADHCYISEDSHDVNRMWTYMRIPAPTAFRPVAVSPSGVLLAPGNVQLDTLHFSPVLHTVNVSHFHSLEDAIHATGCVRTVDAPEACYRFLLPPGYSLTNAGVWTPTDETRLRSTLWLMGGSDTAAGGGGGGGAGVASLSRAVVAVSNLRASHDGFRFDNLDLTPALGTMPDAPLGSITDGGLMALDGTTVAIRNATVQLGVARRGGCFFVAGGALRLTDSTVEGCMGVVGGGVFADVDSSVRMHNVVMAACQATSAGGAITAQAANVTLSASTFRSNGAESGGSVHAGISSQLVMDACVLTNNSAARTGGAVMVEASSGVFTDVTFVENSAIDGAAVMVMSSAQAQFHGVTMSDNSASGSGGALGVDSVASAQVCNSSIVNNTAASVGGGVSVSSASVVSLECSSEVVGNVAGHGGGGVDVSTSATLTITGGRVSNNTVVGSVVPSSSELEGSGGAVQCDDAVLRMSGTTIAHNVAPTSGGGVALLSCVANLSGTVVVEGNSVSTSGGLSTSHGGGGLFAHVTRAAAPTVTFAADTTFQSNVAPRGSAALFYTDADCSAVDTGAADCAHAAPNAAVQLQGAAAISGSIMWLQAPILVPAGGSAVVRSGVIEVAEQVPLARTCESGVTLPPFSVVLQDMYNHSSVPISSDSVLVTASSPSTDLVGTTSVQVSATTLAATFSDLAMFARPGSVVTLRFSHFPQVATTPWVVNVSIESCPAGMELAPSERSCVICAGGTYSPTRNSVLNACVPCSAGYYPTADQTGCQPCGDAGHYCPEYTMDPVAVPLGFYSTPEEGNVTLRSGVLKCPAGFVCVDGIKSECGGPAFVCSEGATSAALIDPGFYGSGGATNATQTSQVPCDAGFYCTGGVRNACPGGRYGSVTELSSSTCSGPCTRGYRCPDGSTSPDALPCGSATTYCPEGSASATSVSLGFYSIDGDGLTVDQLHRVAQQACDVGYWCVDGVRSPCPAGRFGAASQEVSSNCSGVCTGGYYCPEGSSSSVQLACGGPHVYCPEGSGAPTTVGSGFYSTGGSSSSTRTGEARCEAGFYCSGGVRLACKEGHYGESPGQTEETCSGECPVGTTCCHVVALVCCRGTQVMRCVPQDHTVLAESALFVPQVLLAKLPDCRHRRALANARQGSGVVAALHSLVLPDVLVPQQA